MRTTDRSESRHTRLLNLAAKQMEYAESLGFSRIRMGAEGFTGDKATIHGKSVVNFGHCCYLGLNTDERLKQAAIEAVRHYGVSYSSSPAYTAVPLYSELEELMSRIVDAHVVLPTTTTLGHLAALPVLVAPDDPVLMDAQAHASLQLAADVLRGRGSEVSLLPHNDLQALERAVSKAAETHDRVWYIADGVYSMHGDTAPVKEITALLDRHPELHVYYDDAHGFGWQGLHGRGHVLNEVPFHPRTVVSAGLSKSFGSGGAVLAFPDHDDARRVQLCGTTLNFSGPIHQAVLNAAIASARIHLSPEHEELQARMRAQIELTKTELVRHQLPVLSVASTPIWYVRLGAPDRVAEGARRVFEDGFYVNVASYPVASLKHGGLRFMNSLQHSDDQILSLIDSLARHVPEVMDDAGGDVDLRSYE